MSHFETARLSHKQQRNDRPRAAGEVRIQNIKRYRRAKKTKEKRQVSQIYLNDWMILKNDQSVHPTAGVLQQ